VRERGHKGKKSSREGNIGFWEKGGETDKIYIL
jgi:hypothetical protein